MWFEGKPDVRPRAQPIVRAHHGVAHRALERARDRLATMVRVTGLRQFVANKEAAKTKVRPVDYQSAVLCTVCKAVWLARTRSSAGAIGATLQLRDQFGFAPADRRRVSQRQSGRT